MNSVPSFSEIRNRIQHGDYEEWVWDVGNRSLIAAWLGLFVATVYILEARASRWLRQIENRWTLN